MKTIVRFIAAHNLVPISITFICFSYFNTLENSALDYFLAIGASFFCWLFYYIDKIRDNRGQTFEKTERHYLSKPDQIIQLTIGVSLFACTALQYHPINFNIACLFCVLFVISITYIVLVNAGLKTVKEIVSSIIITLSVCFFPIKINNVIDTYFIVAFFFLMIYGNMLLLVLTDEAYDKKHQFNAISARLPNKSIVKLLITILFLLLLVLITPVTTGFKYWAIFYVLFYSLLVWKRKDISGELMHILADMAFMFPLLLL